MGDRIRLGEVLAAIGAVGLTVMLVAGTWLQYASGPLTIQGLNPDSSVNGGLSVLSLGWFMTLLLALAAIGGLAFIFRVLTAKDTERPMLQAPLAYAAALFATPVLLLRLTVFRPNATDVGTVKNAEGTEIALAGPFPTEVAGGGWIGLLFLILILIGTWFAMADERTGTAAAKAQTEALLAGVPTRPVPQPVAVPNSKAPTVAEADAAASAEDQLPTEDDPKTPAPQEKP